MASVTSVVVRVAIVAAVVMGILGPIAGGEPTVAQEPQRYVERLFDDVAITRDIPYGAAPDEYGRTQVLDLDLYLPVGDPLAARPAVVLAHDGAFYSGDKTRMADLATGYARRGFVAMSIEYRMDEAAGPVSYPPGVSELPRVLAAKHDMQAAVRWARGHAATHGIDPRKVSVVGNSAGAVTALLVATTADDPGSSGMPGLSSAVCTAVSLAGTGVLTVIDASDAGALFLHGDADEVVPYAAALGTHQAMVAAGLASEVITLPGVGHVLGNEALVEQRSAEWLVDHMVERESSCAGPVDPGAPAFVRAAFADFLDRSPSEHELISEVGLLDSGATRAWLLGRLTTSEEWVSGIVSDLYLGTLGRPPDAAGLTWWTAEIRTGRRTVAQVAASFYAAPEYIAKGGDPELGWVRDLYAAILGRDVSLVDADFWIGEIRRRGHTHVARQIYGSLESRRARVAALYVRLLGRDPDSGGLGYWAERISRDGDLALARNIAASAEYRARAMARYP